MLILSMKVLIWKKKTYATYRKPNNDRIYIHKHSNHQQNIFRDLPKSISKRISDTSSNEKIFNNHTPIYQQAWNIVIQDSNSHSKEKQKKRSYKIIWFNSPFSRQMLKWISWKYYLEYRVNTSLKQINCIIFNSNTAKISYSCIRNMGSIISAYNQHVLTPNSSSFRCNCRNKSNCPL